MYANDILVTCKASANDVTTIKEVFEWFREWSGLMVNNGKSSIFFFPNMDKRLNVLVKQILGFKEMKQRAMISREFSCFG